MRGILVGSVAWLVAASGLADTPRGGSEPTVPSVSGVEARQYAIQLLEIVEQVANKYYRPVSRADLLVAAVRSLYEAADQRVPPQLTLAIQEAVARQGNLAGGLAAIRSSLGNPESLRGPGALRVSVQGMMRVLDPYSGLMTDAELRRRERFPRNFGLGIEWEPPGPADALVVREVTLGGPAQRAGIRPGDEVTHLDGLPAAGRTSLQRLRAPGTCAMTIRRSGEVEPRTVTLAAEEFRPETVLGVVRQPNNQWEYFIDPALGLAYVRLSYLDSTTPEALFQVMLRLRASNLRGLVLDLRWCPGGYLEEARDVAEYFLDKYSLPFFLLPAPGNLVGLADLCLETHCANATVKYRDEPDERNRKVAGKFTGFPMIVLVNGETSGGAELIAAVFQDNRRALVAGQRTRGKASVQTIVRLRDELRPSMNGPIPDLGIKVTHGMLIRPSGRNLHRHLESRLGDDWGVRPDPALEFRVSPEMSKKLSHWWQMQNLRPGASVESLPLDDPTADPQRLASVLALKRILHAAP